MKVLILGADGYLGYPLTAFLKEKGHIILALDCGIKRKWERETDSAPLVEQPSFFEKMRPIGVSLTQENISLRPIDSESTGLDAIMDQISPDAVIHLAEQPSAPYSMLSYKKTFETMQNNVMGTLALIHAVTKYNKRCHIIKLGSMGEYGTPNIDIEEGYLDVEHMGRRDRVLYPKRPGSFYHLSKVHDSANLEFATRTWGLRCTDLNQGIVYGYQVELDGINIRSSFHYDSIFGTALNRFITQAVVKKPITIYGRGGQTRGFLNIQDTMRCIELALLHPADEGQFRVFNQFTEQFSIKALAYLVRESLSSLGMDTRIEYLENPRVEEEGHYYKAKHTALTDLGLEPTLLTPKVIRTMATYVGKHKDKIDVNKILPKNTWRN